MVDARDPRAPVVEPVQDTHAVATLQQHAHQMRADVTGAAGDEHPVAEMVAGGRRTITDRRAADQLVELDSPGPVQLFARHEPLHAVHRASADADILELPHERVEERGVGGGHRHDHLSDPVTLAHCCGVGQRAQHPGAVEHRADLAGVVV